MPRHKPAWILVKGTEYNPDRSLSVGQILVEPNEPSYHLLTNGPLPIPNIDIEFSFQEGVQHSTANSLGVSFGVWANADMLPVQGDVGMHFKKDISAAWKFTRLEGRIFTPRLEYVNRSLNSEDVKHHIENHRFSFRKRLYMVTGVRIARGSSKIERASHDIGAHLKVGVDTAAFGWPITAGISPSFKNDTPEARSFQNASDFVYAYRLAEIHYGKHVSVKPYMHGETYASGPVGSSDDEKPEFGLDDEDDDEGSTVDSGGIIVERISKEDYDGDGELQEFSSETEDYYMLRGGDTGGDSVLPPD